MRSMKCALRSMLEKGSGVGSFDVFFSVLRTAGLEKKIMDGEPFTLFVPTDEAFTEVAQETLQDWHRPGSKSQLREVLTYHLVPGRLPARELIRSSSVKSVQGTGLTIRFAKNRIHVNNALVLQPDIECDVGVIHVLDKVVVPR